MKNWLWPHRKSGTFTCITQTHRLGTAWHQKDLLVSTFLHKTRKAIRPKQTLPLRTEEPLPPVRALAAFAAKDFCSLDLCWHYFSCWSCLEALLLCFTGALATIVAPWNIAATTACCPELKSQSYISMPRSWVPNHVSLTMVPHTIPVCVLSSGIITLHSDSPPGEGLSSMKPVLRVWKRLYLLQVCKHQCKIIRARKIRDMTPKKSK